MIKGVASRIATLEAGPKVGALVTMDIFLAPLALCVSVLVLGHPLASLFGQPGVAVSLATLTAVGLVCALVFGSSEARLRNYEGTAIAGTALQSACLGLSAAAIFGSAFAPGTYAVFGMAMFLAAVLSRVLLRGVLRALYRSSESTIPVIIYGAGTTGMQMAAALRRDHAIAPVAFVDDNPTLHGRKVAGLRVRPALKLAQLADRHRVRRVILAMPSATPARRAEIAARVRRLGLEAQSLPSFAQLVGEKVSPDQLSTVRPSDLLGREHRACDDRLLARIYRGRTVLVTGAGGSIGSELCRQLLALGPKRLVLLEMSELALFQVSRSLELAREGQPVEIVPVLGSVGDARLVRSVLADQEVEIVLHAAAYKHVPLVERNVLAGLSNNVLGTHTLAREAMAAGVERFILVSSDKAVRPVGAMGATKRLSELVVQDLAGRAECTRFAAVRFGNVLGSSGSVVSVFREQIAAGGPVTLTDAAATRYFMTVEEAVHLVLVAGGYAGGGEIFVLDMGEPVRIGDLARKMIQAAGYTVRDADCPDGDIEIRVTGLREGERVHELRMTDGARPGTAHPAILTIDAGVLSEIELAAVLRDIRAAVSAGAVHEARHILDRFIAEHGPAPALSAAAAR